MTKDSARARTKANIRNNWSKLSSLRTCLDLMLKEGYGDYEDIAQAIYLQSELLDKMEQINRWLSERI